MADASQIVSPILKAVAEKLGSRFWTEVELLWSVGDDIQELQNIISTISRVLNDAEQRSFRSMALLGWLSDVKDATFDADDVVDEFHTEALRQRTRSDNCITGQVCDFFSSNNPIVFNFRIAHKIKDLRKRFKDLADLKRDFILTDQGSSSSERIGSSSSETINDRETHSRVNESQIYGRDNDKERIIYFLMNMDNDKDVSVLPIVGLGGVGKTTVAKLVYNDDRIKECFELRIWVCVSEDFDVKVIAKTIIERITKKECMPSDLETVQQCLQQQLRDKKILLVLDDIWNENARKWSRLKSLLEGGRVGSKIIVTTRSNTVAAIMCTVKAPYKLDVLSDDDCWIIFKCRAFGVEREENPMLVEIGMEIVSRCKGIPLVANALGSLMATKYGEIEWLGVKNSEIWRLPKDEVEIIPALKLSYDYLSPHLKHCFAYCSLFPKDFRVSRWDLVQLWIAEGFVPMQEKDKLAEDVGNEYFNSLLSRSFFQEEQRNVFGDIESCKMHDLMHDLACYVARGESCTVQVGREPSVVNLHRCRYIFVAPTVDSKITLATMKFICGAKLLRSLFLVGTIEKPAIDIISNLIYLRALDLSYTSVTELPSIIGKLQHLRFLDLSRTSIQVLPDSISNLYNVQTLKLRECRELKVLPEGTRNMSNLRHLDISKCHSLTCVPHGLGRLRSLQTLPLFIVGEEPGRTIVELQHLNLIRSQLQIKQLHNVKDPVEAREARLSEKTSLQDLKLFWKFEDSDLQVDVLENLRPPASLRSLKIKNYGGNRLPSWLTGTYDISLPLFPSLTSLALENMCNIEEWLVPERAGVFPCLEELKLSNCPKLTVQSYLPSLILKLRIAYCNVELLAAGGSLQGLSRLGNLEISFMKASESDWEGLQHLTALQKLEIICCFNLTFLPEGVMNLPSLQSLSFADNQKLESISRRRRRGEGEVELEPPPPPLFFTTLRHLEIRFFYALTALPEWLGCLTSLHSLTLRSCHKLAMLPDGMKHLTSLHSLTLGDCPILEMLPDGMKHLTSLQFLSIWGCPILERRCERERGDDWHQIAHIPNIQIISCWCVVLAIISLSSFMFLLNYYYSPCVC